MLGTSFARKFCQLELYHTWLSKWLSELILPCLLVWPLMYLAVTTPVLIWLCKVFVRFISFLPLLIYFSFWNLRSAWLPWFLSYSLRGISAARITFYKSQTSCYRSIFRPWCFIVNDVSQTFLSAKTTTTTKYDVSNSNYTFFSGSKWIPENSPSWKFAEISCPASTTTWTIPPSQWYGRICLTSWNQ